MIGPADSNDPPAGLTKVFGRLFQRYVAAASRHTGLILALLLCLGGLAVLPVLKLELHTDLVELLPENHSSVIAMRSIAGRQKSATNLVMLVESPDADANRRFADALRPQLEPLIPEIFTEIQWRPESEIPDYAARWKWLYADMKDLESAETLLDRIIARRTSPLMVDLEGDPEQELKGLRERLNQKLPPPVPETPYFTGKEGNLQLLGVMMWRRRDGLGSLGDYQTLAAVKAAVQRVNPTSFHPQLKVRYTGHISHALDESKAVRDDLTTATAICVSLVLLAIYSYFRRFALLLIIGAPAVLGLLLAMAVARFTIEYLNMNTAFLISIILGNGINTPIILLARYGEERQRGREVPEALTTAMTQTLLATVTAVAAASIAYGCLLLTSFRGFNQFGLVGGAGMLLVWTVTFLLVPPLCIWGERRWPGLLTPRRSLWLGPFALIGRLAERFPRLLAALAIVLVAASLVPLSRYAKDPLEWNFDNLRSEDTESQALWPRMEALGMGSVGAGYIGNDGVLIVEKPEQADAVAEAMRKKDAALGDKHVLAAVRTLSSTLPAAQADKLELLGRVRRKIDKHRDLMNEDEWREVSAFRPPDYLRPLTVDDLPRQVREAFTEVDGTRGRLIGIDSDPTTYYAWRGQDLLRIAEALRVEALGKTWIAASVSTIFAGVLETIIRDGPKVTKAALVGVTALMFLSFGLRGALPVLGALAVGCVWVGALLGLISLKLNFMNFVALPITLGVGADYAANIWARLRGGAERVSTAITHTGSAVALCSATTIIGYSSLLLSRNRALRSFGLLADLGEITCLLAALLVLPAFVQFFARRAKP